jgi:hypothetical protein
VTSRAFPSVSTIVDISSGSDFAGFAFAVHNCGHFVGHRFPY